MAESESESQSSAAERHDRDERGRFETVEPASESASTPEPASEPAPAPAPTPATVSKPKQQPSQQRKSSAPSKLDGATVVLSALVYQAGMRNSASVAAVQDRLSEMGLAAVRGDRRGWLSDCTVDALRDFQKSAGLDANGLADRKTVEALFSGVRVTITD